jgi:hypothetical protein
MNCYNRSRNLESRPGKSSQGGQENPARPGLVFPGHFTGKVAGKIQPYSTPTLAGKIQPYLDRTTKGGAWAGRLLKEREEGCCYGSDTPPVAPALAKVTIYEVTMRLGYELVTSAQVDDRIYVGSREWRQQQSDNKKSS